MNDDVNHRVFHQVAGVQENTRYKAVTASSLDQVAERHPRLAEHLEDIKLSVSRCREQTITFDPPPPSPSLSPPPLPPSQRAGSTP